MAPNNRAVVIPAMVMDMVMAGVMADVRRVVLGATLLPRLHQVHVTSASASMDAHLVMVTPAAAIPDGRPTRCRGRTSGMTVTTALAMPPVPGSASISISGANVIMATVANNRIPTTLIRVQRPA